MSIPSSLTPLFNSGSSAAAGGYQVSRSLRFNSADSAYLSRTPAVAGSRTTWTWAGWVKRSAINSDDVIFSASSSGNTTFRAGFDASTHRFYLVNGVSDVSTLYLETSQVFRDFSAWYHIVIAVDTTIASPSSDRAKLYVNGNQVTNFASTNYGSQNANTLVNATIGHAIGTELASYGFHDGYLAECYLIDGQQLTHTSFTEVSATTGQLIPKAYSGTFGTNGFWLKFSDNSAATAATLGKDYSGNSNNWTPNNLTATTNPVYSNSVTEVGGQVFYGGGSAKKVFDGDIINGNDNYGTTGNTPSNTNCIRATFTTPSTNVTSLRVYGAGNSSFTCKVWYNNDESTKIDILDPVGWKTFTLGSPITLSSLSWGNNASSNGGMNVRAIEVNGTILVDGVPSNIDSLVDTPTSYGTDTGVGGEVRGNYATLNPLYTYNGTTLRNGNLDFLYGSGQSSASATMSANSGKYYCEMTPTTINTLVALGVFALSGNSNGANVGPGQTSRVIYLSTTGIAETNIQVATYATYTTSDVIGIALNLDASPPTVAFYKNGSLQGTINLSTSFYNWTFALLLNGGGDAGSANFGQRPFAYTAPSGFKALCDTNLPAPLTAKPNTLMDVALYTGNGGTQTISGLNFSPDWVWIKSRANTQSHQLYDTNRGAGKSLISNNTNTEETNAAYGYLSAFNADGFTVTTGITDADFVNKSTWTYVAWAWDAGTSTVSNTAGSITSQVRANVSAGFSVVTYTGNGGSNVSVGHGLGVAPVLLIVKSRSTSGDWDVTYTFGDGSYDFMSLNTTAAKLDIAGRNAPTSTLFYVNGGLSNVNATTYVCYAFSPVVGYSSFGSYTGNASADGPFVYTGMRPRWLMLKCTGTTAYWFMYDTARDADNVVEYKLYPNDSAAENGVAGETLSTNAIDILSNGFKLRNANGSNFSSQPYIYAAFAENPFQYSRAR